MALLPLSKSIIAANVVLMVLATSAVVARIYTSRITKNSLKLDDYFIVFALALAIGVCILGIYGGATNLIASPIMEATLHDLSRTILIVWIDALFCFLCYGIIKISILLFYRRIFTTQKFKIVSGVVLGVVVCETLAVALAQIFSANPVDRWWNYPAGYNPFEHNYNTVINYQLFLVVTAALNLFLDLTVLTLPILPIRALNMNRKKKVMLTIVFGLGAFCVIASAVRFQYTYRLWEIYAGKKPATNLTTMNVWNDVWANIEACSSIVAACLPTIVPLIKNFTNHRHLLSIPQYYGHVKQLFSSQKSTSTRRQDQSAESLQHREKRSNGSEEDGGSSIFVGPHSAKGTYTESRALEGSSSSELEQV